jgi:cyclopropane fatty-acyl-phospholipid synthase-like methyltransferase
MRSTQEWRFWGRQDPMWAVATWKGRQREGANPWTLDDFRAAGRSDCADIMRHWDHYGRLSGGTCIEIGCGSARLTLPLLGYFDRVLGIDVSPDQLDLAREVLGAEVWRVDFKLVDSPSVDVAPGSCSGMISTHVFQHLSSYSGIVAYLRATFDALKPGASICFQTPVPGADKGDVPSRRYRAFQFVATRARRLAGRYSFMEYNRYPANRIVSTLQSIGYRDVEVRIFALTTTGFRQSFFFARKPVL